MERDMRPTCAKCGRKVDELKWWYDPIKRGWVYVARCHGRTERTFVHEHDLMSSNKPVTIEPGTAFGDEPLPGRQ